MYSVHTRTHERGLQGVNSTWARGQKGGLGAKRVALEISWEKLAFPNITWTSCPCGIPATFAVWPLLLLLP